MPRETVIYRDFIAYKLMGSVEQTGKSRERLILGRAKKGQFKA